MDHLDVTSSGRSVLNRSLMNARLAPFIAATLFWAIVAPVLAAGPNAPVTAEVTIEEEGSLARVSVYLVNRSKEPVTLFTGRAGTSAQGRFTPVDLDRVTKETPRGRGALVVPELSFGALKISAPTTAGFGMTYRNMLPTLLELPEDEQVFYCVFSVPAAYVEKEFLSGLLRFPPLRGAKELPGLEVPVVKCTRKK